MSEENNKSGDEPEEPTIRGGVKLIVTSEGLVQMQFVPGEDGMLHIHDLLVMSETLRKETQYQWDDWKKKQSLIVKPSGSILRPV